VPECGCHHGRSEHNWQIPSLNRASGPAGGSHRRVGRDTATLRSLTSTDTSRLLSAPPVNHPRAGQTGDQASAPSLRSLGSFRLLRRGRRTTRSAVTADAVLVATIGPVIQDVGSSSDSLQPAGITWPAGSSIRRWSPKSPLLRDRSGGTRSGTRSLRRNVLYLP